MLIMQTGITGCHLDPGAQSKLASTGFSLQLRYFPKNPKLIPQFRSGRAKARTSDGNVLKIGTEKG